MKKIYIIILLSVMCITGLQAQVTLVPGTNVVKGNNVIQGTKISALTTTERDQLQISPSIGVIIYNIDTGCQEYWNGIEWVSLCAGGHNWFYMPSIVLPTDPATLSWGTYDAGTQVFTIDLYTEIYARQFRLADATTSYKSAGAGTLPLKAADELEYFIVYYDKEAFTIQSLDANGVLKYKADPAKVTEKTFMNIVFKIK